MSLILEALRKSEAERRRAQAPDLFAEPQLALPRPPHAWPQWMWPVLGVVGLIAILMLLRAMWPQATPAASTQVPQPLPVAKNMPPSTASSEAGKPAVAQSATAVAPLPQPAPRPESPAAAVRPPAADASPTPPAVAAGIPALQQPRMTPEPVVVAPARAPAPAPVPTPVREPATGSDTMRLSDLGTEERQQLPTLKLSMHMWNDAPAQRFVILDGQRLGEGDRIGDAVVEQITRDGAILDWNGRRLRVSMR